MSIGKRTPAATAAQTHARPSAATPINKGRDMDTQQSVASLLPEDFTQGGLLDDVDVLFESCRFVEWDYNGSIDHPVLALLIKMQYDDNGKPSVAEQFYSAGDLSRFIPSEDGCRAVAVAGARGLAGGTNVAELLKSVFDQGFPQQKFVDSNMDVSTMDGMRCHINRVPQQKRSSAIQTKNQAGYDLTVAVVTKIHQMPWEENAANGKAPAPAPRRGGTGTAGAHGAARPTSAATAPGRSAPTPAPSNGEAVTGDDMHEVAAGILLEILGNKGGEVKKQQLAPAAFKPLTGNPQRSGILALITNEDWLAENGENFGWSYDNGVITQASA